MNLSCCGKGEIKGNKRQAQLVLDNRLEELSQQYAAVLESKNILFLAFMQDWPTIQVPPRASKRYIRKDVPFLVSLSSPKRRKEPPPCQNISVRTSVWGMTAPA